MQRALTFEDYGGFEFKVKRKSRYNFENRVEFVISPPIKKLIGISGHTAVQDNFNRMWLYDGWNGLNAFNTRTWEFQHFDVDMDYEISKRRNHTCVQYNNKLVFFGGHEEAVMSAIANELDKYCNDLLEFDFDQKKWDLIDQKNKIGVRRNHTAIVMGDEMVVTGGVIHFLSTVFPIDLYIFNFKTKSWRRTKRMKRQPAPRFGHGCVYDPDSNRLFIIFGIDNFNLSRGDIWCFHFKKTRKKDKKRDFPNSASYSSLCSSNFSSSSSLTSLEDQLMSPDDEYLSDGYFDSDSEPENIGIPEVDSIGYWEKLETWGDTPIDRGFHGCCISKNQIFILGGKKVDTVNGSVGEKETFLNDLFMLDIRTNRWRRISFLQHRLASMISPRSNLTLVSHQENKLICFGGFEGRTHTRKAEIFEIWTPQPYMKREVNFLDCVVVCQL